MLTTIGQDATGISADIGINPDMIVGQFVDALRDTVVQSVMMGGATVGAGHHVAKANTTRSAADLARSKGFLVPPAPGLDRWQTAFPSSRCAISRGRDGCRACYSTGRSGTVVACSGRITVEGQAQNCRRRVTVGEDRVARLAQRLDYDDGATHADRAQGDPGLGRLNVVQPLFSTRTAMHPNSRRSRMSPSPRKSGGCTSRYGL